MNAEPAALTARTDRRFHLSRRAFASFFQAEITLEKTRKEDNEWLKNNRSLGGNYCGMRWKSRAECSNPIPQTSIAFLWSALLFLTCIAPASYKTDGERTNNEGVDSFVGEFVGDGRSGLILADTLTPSKKKRNRHMSSFTSPSVDFAQR
jgi:hypothetical protein